MNDLPRFKNALEILASVTLLAISGLSLWVAIGTEDANRRMVAAASWPFLQLESTNLSEDGKLRISLALTNSGVGPAKVESFELFWKGQAYASSYAYLAACCGLDPRHYTADTKMTSIATNPLRGTVIRAGDSRLFLEVPLADDNQAVWKALNHARFRTEFRVCYCSVFDECWLSGLKGLNPKQVGSCPLPKIPYTE
jgi:hypothetical protein